MDGVCTINKTIQVLECAATLHFLSSIKWNILSDSELLTEKYGHNNEGLYHLVVE